MVATQHDPPFKYKFTKTGPGEVSPEAVFQLTAHALCFVHSTPGAVTVYTCRLRHTCKFKPVSPLASYVMVQLDVVDVDTGHSVKAHYAGAAVRLLRSIWLVDCSASPVARCPYRTATAPPSPGTACYSTLYTIDDSFRHWWHLSPTGQLDRLEQVPRTEENVVAALPKVDSQARLYGVEPNCSGAAVVQQVRTPISEVYQNARVVAGPL